MVNLEENRTICLIKLKMSEIPTTAPPPPPVVICTVNALLGTLINPETLIPSNGTEAMAY